MIRCAVSSCMSLVGEAETTTSHTRYKRRTLAQQRGEIVWCVRPTNSRCLVLIRVFLILFDEFCVFLILFVLFCVNEKTGRVLQTLFLNQDPLGHITALVMDPFDGLLFASIETSGIRRLDYVTIMANADENRDVRSTFGRRPELFLTNIYNDQHFKGRALAIDTQDKSV